ncbi:fibrous sheath CABYR-binding protein-like [Labrus mixtus]|uniref:fibrous sheath CABYR-binding protein-like n=1 Tax=Labrus mixtus TaxID=508554 RepID=UPI0029C0F4C2|nr:fibrous sheath CABYR-binding protein-like [Labrus mixtus]
MPELLTAVQILASSTAEIAAASVGDSSLVKADKGLDTTWVTTQPEAPDATTKVEDEEATEEAAAVVNEEELESVVDTEAPAAEEQTEEETDTPVADSAEGEEAAACLLEDLTTPAPTLEEQGEVEAEGQALVPEAAPEEAVSFTDASPEDSAPVEEAPTTEEAVSYAEAAPVDETSTAASSLEEAPAEAPSEKTVEVLETQSEDALVVNTIQLAAASSGSFLEAVSASEPECAEETSEHEAGHCHSCHSAPSSAEEVAPPAAYGGHPAVDGSDDMMHETNEAESLVEGQTTETMVVVTAQS